MAQSTNRVVDTALEDGAQYYADTYKWLATGTGTDDTQDDDTTLGASVQIGTGTDSYNKFQESGTLDTYVDGRNFQKKFILDVGEPNSQPVVLGEFGWMKQVISGAGLGSRAKLNVPFTKDSSLKTIVRFTGRVNRIEDYTGE